MFKFNNGNGAIICDKCSIIIKEPCDPRQEEKYDLCEKCNVIKQVIVMRIRYPDGKGGFFKPRTGKLVSQGAHASMAVFFNRMEKIRYYPDDGNDYDAWECDMTEEMEKWKEGIFTKITVSCNSEQELLDAYKKAQEANIVCSIIKDCGKTEFNGVATYTCIAIGPDKASKIDLITGDFPLL